MLFKKKKDELNDQLAAYQERGAPRWGAPQVELKAGISITGYDGEGQLGNVSVSGCSLLSVTYVNIVPDKVYEIKIMPAAEDKIKPFSQKMKLSWTKSSEEVYMAGFSLESGESDFQLKSYIDILRSKGIFPDYGNKNSSGS